MDYSPNSKSPKGPMKWDYRLGTQQHEKEHQNAPRTLTELAWNLAYSIRRFRFVATID